MERKVYGVFVAGGHGTRMGSDVPKQFLEIDGIPVLQRTIGRFLEACPEMNIITVLPKECFQLWKDLCVKHDFDFPQRLVAGGLTRFHSVKNALDAVPDGAVVMIHDGVRPLVGKGLIRNMLAQMESCRALIPVIPVTDTLKALETGPAGDLVHSAGEDPSRSGLFCAQTPQIFYSETLKEAYSQGYDTSFTDDASVLQKKGKPLSFTLGERLNIKITTPEDLVIASAVISSSKQSDN